MLQVATNSERGAGSRGNSDEWRNESLLGHKAEMKEEKPCTAMTVKGDDVIDKQ